MSCSCPQSTTRHEVMLGAVNVSGQWPSCQVQLADRTVPSRAAPVSRSTSPAHQAASSGRATDALDGEEASERFTPCCAPSVCSCALLALLSPSVLSIRWKICQERGKLEEHESLDDPRGARGAPPWAST